MQQITVIGAGLAGSEAAWQLAERGIMVNLYEMRPTKTTPAHQTDRFAELVCSNSLRGAGIENAVGLLKEEMRRLGSLIMEAADHNAVPAGGALAVDRELFSSEITKRLEQHPNLRVHREEVHSLPVGMTIVASGPLTSDDLAHDILKATGEQALSFYDAAAPIVTLESIDLEKAFWASRYDKGDADYLNCPMTREEYEAFYKALLEAEMAEVQGFEQGRVFEGCLPVEVMAKRGIQTLTFGPLKPVGLIDPRTGKKSHAVVQLRKENQAGTLFNLVGFQTHLKWGEQKRVFSLIPGLEKAEFVRYGVMHRNTFLNAPKVLKADFSLRLKPELFFAGQMTGVEGYVESAASGLLAGLNAWRRLNQLDTLVFPPESSLGALARHLEGAPSQSFQPMNINFGLLPPLSERIRDKRQKNARISERALAALAEFCAREDLGR
ncbi:methylenetetrahydrofolate--tRNA-(uracil(54)-C(5))-methyltransferase (FADH(2)-oxidizing) TrmFO [Desulfosporosinus sp. BICA1-9]|uniref:methylenetetrahydrofolate--tRNA-(uracil(54)- C(5))-methyltransferase (FADH(2)-oxidizing) TrmFO n=1 Tax=Desulfosporosinus sp. BICA1-9 TaxID=1531958 RepID=UPI00054C18D3|nr:methylenetetrahydrofolate--tRNA-(uracil(54)-C(5))-methyltransferase (FADH(2)-oxidizing) TrmFO [Desulfosporosinus sp. BICA1-9]KJS45914.1 MAG: tRNA (uracil-5-)-methyltransferase [Peptococcaceae bacterium BRH_c23]KJS90579.1 MAG: tRNA (uracil-5-)-methyltransferase [Desulfosporosinus sp. BICA1-9]HBW35039.1 FADH(2)-oxidizing methylenetetrahydrofolate--tRNA-(uracil(54)-C(5))-methyltransferase TrmFO [Desulfosporosinus sp.]